MDANSLVGNAGKGALLFVGVYFVLRSFRRLCQETSSTPPPALLEPHSRLCTAAMGAAGSVLICATAHTF